MREQSAMHLRKSTLRGRAFARYRRFQPESMTWHRVMPIHNPDVYPKLCKRVIGRYETAAEWTLKIGELNNCDWRIRPTQHVAARRIPLPVFLYPSSSARRTGWNHGSKDLSVHNRSRHQGGARHKNPHANSLRAVADRSSGVARRWHRCYRSATVLDCAVREIVRQLTGIPRSRSRQADSKTSPQRRTP
jgi:hypothetical protein